MSQQIIRIPNWQQDEANVIVFTISSSPENRRPIYRRYREFEALNKKLAERNFPSLKLPGKLFIHSDENIEGRRVKLEEALNEYLEMNGFNPILEDFLNYVKKKPSSSSFPTISKKASSSEGGKDKKGQIVVDEQGLSKDEQSNTPTKTDSTDSTLLNDDHQQEQGQHEEQPSNKVHYSETYTLWGMEMLAARAAFRAEYQVNLRLAKIYALLAILSLGGSKMTNQINGRFGLLGTSATSALFGFSLYVGSLWSRKKEDWRRRGFGFNESALSCSDAIDSKTLSDYLEKRGRGNSIASSEENNVSQLVEVGTKKVEENNNMEEKKEGTTPSKQNEENGVKVETSELLSTLDDMHQENNHVGVLFLFEDLEQSELTDSELIWRHARGAYYHATSLDNEKAGDLLRKALIKVKTALETPDPTAQHTTLAALNKWAAILENAFAEREGSIKTRVEAGFAFEAFTRRALDLTPNDPTLHYMLGRFYSNIYPLSWFERKAAKAIAGKEPPKCDVDDALNAFRRAFDLNMSPAYSLEIARCYLQMKDKNSAKEYLLRTKALPISRLNRVEEEGAILEANELLTSL